MFWWLEIITKDPYCIYYFGPFDSLKEAQEEQSGYIEDLKQEGVGEIYAQIKLSDPVELTICQD
ncbi:MULTISPECIES: DUF1816 domain-containing protein [Aerosakkonema]|uniref:DUF1816 domain-containing protein n=1 Tax=Aerosakkonema TaxID=1246629 RepID=UPI0035B8E585